MSETNRIIRGSADPHHIDQNRGRMVFSVRGVVRVLADQPSQRGATNHWAKLRK